MALFGSAKKDATDEFKQLVWPVLIYHKQVGIKQKKFLLDPFVYGFLWGSYGAYRDAPPCAQLSNMQKGGVMSALIEMIQPTWSGIFGLIQLVVSPLPDKKYQREQNPDWKRGLINGSKYVRWLYSIGNISEDADVHQAFESAKMYSISILGPGEVVIKDPTHEQVTEILFRHLFEEVVEDRFKKPAA
jgi:hypothetical protein